MDGQAQPLDIRVAVSGGLELRVLRWEPDLSTEGAANTHAGGGVRRDTMSDAPPYLLVHGLASNARLWDGVARGLAGAGRRSAAVDLRGHGRSDKPDSGYDFATVSADLHDLVAALGFDRPVLAGQSWGGGVVLDFAVRYPESTRGVVLVDGGLTDLRDGFSSWDECWARLAPPELIGLPYADIEGYFRRNHADWAAEGIEGSLANFEVRPDGTIAPWLTRERHKAILAAMWDQRTAELWNSLRVPALIVPVDGGPGGWTDGKRAAAAAAESAMLASGTPVAVHWFEGDHDVHAQHPEELAAAILEAEQEGLFGPVKVR